MGGDTQVYVFDGGELAYQAPFRVAVAGVRLGSDPRCEVRLAELPPLLGVWYGQGHHRMLWALAGSFERSGGRPLRLNARSDLAIGSHQLCFREGREPPKMPDWRGDADVWTPGAATDEAMVRSVLEGHLLRP